MQNENAGKVEIPQAVQDKLAETIYLQLIGEVHRRNPGVKVSQTDYEDIAQTAYRAMTAFYAVRPNVPFGPPRDKSRSKPSYKPATSSSPAPAPAPATPPPPVEATTNA